MSLFVGTEWRYRYREQACGHSGGRKERQKDVFFKRITLLLRWECTIARQDWKQGDYFGGFCNSQMSDDDGSDHHRGFPGGSVVNNLLSVHQMWFRSLGPKDPLEEEMEIHSSVLAWKIPCTEEPNGLQSMGPQRVKHDWARTHRTTDHHQTFEWQQWQLHSNNRKIYKIVKKNIISILKYEYSTKLSIMTCRKNNDICLTWKQVLKITSHAPFY